MDHPTPEVTHLLLDVPSFGADGNLRGGKELRPLLSMLPETITVVGGNLHCPGLAGYRCWDLLKEEAYLAQNAAITAECALQVAYSQMEYTFAGTPVLILGWGRIGKCLGQLLSSMGAKVSIAVRKEADRAMIQALGFEAVAIREVSGLLAKYRVLFNTVPELLLTQEQLAPYKNCVKIDLASKPGLEGADVLWSRGLPGVYAPETSGNLIARTIQKFLEEDAP